MTNREFESCLGLAVVLLESEEKFQGRKFVNEARELSFSVTSQAEVVSLSLLPLVKGTLFKELGHKLVASLIQVSRVDSYCIYTNLNINYYHAKIISRD